MMRRITRYFITITFIALVAVTLAACDPSWEDMTVWTTGPRCDRPALVGAAAGDFTQAQLSDISGALSEIYEWARIPFVWNDSVPWRRETQPDYSVAVEMRGPWPDYSLPETYDAEHHFMKARAWFGPDWNRSLPSPTAPTYDNVGLTFRARVVHALLHAVVGLGDLYDNDDGHHGAIMGRGFEHFNKMALGDILGAIAKGCRPQAEKDRMTRDLLEAYG